MASELSRKEWLERRRKYIGGSDAAAALGVSRFKTRLQLCLDKWGEADDEPTEVMRRGTILEPLVAHLYHEATAHSTAPGSWIMCEYYPWMAATPDLVDKDEDCIVQLKTASWWGRHKWGESGSQDIPDDYMIQAQHEMTVTDATRNMLGVLFADESTFRGLVYMAKAKLPVERLCEFVQEMILAKNSQVEFCVYPIDRDPGLIATIIEQERDFWETYVVPHVTPPDESIPEKSSAIITADTKAAKILEKYFAAREDEKSAKELVDQWATQIKTMIGDKSGIVADGVGKITYKAPTAKPKTDYEAIAKAMRSSDEMKYDVLAEKFTKTVQGKRSFRPYPAK